MSKVITFSRVFPTYHPRAGEPTYFVEKLHWAITSTIFESWPHADAMLRDLNKHLPENIIQDFIDDLDDETDYSGIEKNHTIRAGHRWKVGDKFSPRVWSGKPYNSKQIIIAPDIEVKKIWDVEFDEDGCFWIFSDKERGPRVLHRVAKNDGLTKDDLIAWFNKPFTGQIICWNETINY